MNDAHAGKRLPQPTPVTAPFWDACRDGRLLIQRCVNCAHIQFYPRVVCTSCMGQELEWVEASGLGTVRTYTVIRLPVSRAYAEEIPYANALVQLEEGPTMMSALANCDPEQVETGLPVEVVFERWSDEITMPKFQPRSSG